MAKIIVGTKTGCRVYSESGQADTELNERRVWVITPADKQGRCFAVVDKTVRVRNADGKWSLIAETGSPLASLTSLDKELLGGLMMEAGLVRITKENVERIKGFDITPGKNSWFPSGPPLHIRSIARTADKTTLLAAVHVGGIPRSTDGGLTWTPTIPIADDVHEVRAHKSRPNIVAASAAVGLYISRDCGVSWELLRATDLTPTTESLSLAFLEDEVFFSLQDGGAFAKRSQLWRWRIQGNEIEQVREGLPEYFVGKLDTNHIAASDKTAAVLDGGGNLWVKDEKAPNWKQIASNLPDAYCVQVV